MKDSDFIITVHDEGDGTRFAHVCSYENPCGDQLACRYCRYH